MSKIRNDLNSLRAMSCDQLMELLTLKKREMLNIRFQAATGQLQKGALQLSSLRRFIARVKTIQNERYLSLKKV
jgi:large subunit ribosomal protein L29